MKDNFIITKQIKNLINDFDKYLTNFPHKEIELKREIMNTSYEMLKIRIEANTTYDNNKRIDIEDKIISYIKYLYENKKIYFNNYLNSYICYKNII